MSVSTWIDEHLEMFVRPVLGRVPDLDEDEDDISPWCHALWKAKFSTPRVALLNTIWQEAKRKAQSHQREKILLPGRDTFLLEVLAKVEGFPATLFRPEISSAVATGGVKVLPESTEWGALCYGIDSGYRGSVLDKLKVPKFGLVSYNSTGARDAARDAKQIIPELNAQIATNLCAALEGCPKYWTRGGYNEKNVVIQTPSLPHEFVASAVLTRHVVAVLNPKVTVAVPETYDKVLAGATTAQTPTGVDIKDGKGWFWNNGVHHGWTCSGYQGQKGCGKPIKTHKWFYGTTYAANTGSYANKATGQVLCHRCCEKLGMIPPSEIPVEKDEPVHVPAVAMGAVTVPTGYLYATSSSTTTSVGTQILKLLTGK